MGTWNGIELDGLVLHSGRLTLRPWQPSDAVAVEQIMADRRIGRYLPLPWPYTRADATDFVNEHALAGRRDGSRLDCALAENSSGRLVGSATLILPRGGRPGAEIGYWLGSEFWGSGYITEAVQTLTRFGFGNGLARIRIICEVPNLASARVALRAGYRYETVARSEATGRDGAVDAAVFARLPDDSGEPIAPAWVALAPLSDGVVSVRQLQPEDWPVVLAESSNPESLGWGFGGDLMDEAEARRRAEHAGLQWLVGGQANLLICDAETGAGAGTLTLRPVGPPGVAGIGYGILPEFRGRRFTTRALRLVADWAFDQAGLVRLELGCKVDNRASARTAEAAGFVADARYRSRLRNPDGSYSDEIGYGLVRPPG
ncbi:MAG: GNAT family N-acetyltransferase [Jatrophihabitantaceae bacterium]